MVMRAADLGFVHEALFYEGGDGFLAGTVPFIVDGLEAGEPVMVAVPGVRIDMLRSVLPGSGDGVVFADMDVIGANPARIIPAWHDFLAQRAPGHRPVRGIGEPIGPHRGPAALLECQRHEVLLNVAFADRPAWWLLCPYDTTALHPDVVEEAGRSHRYLLRDGEHTSSAAYGSSGPAGFADPLPEPVTPVDTLEFGDGALASVRQFVNDAATRRGLDQSRLPDLLVAVNELITNSVCHGGGHGRVRVWREADSVTITCEVRDGGVITEPLAGRSRPDSDDEGGRGLWIVNQLCDLVEMRSTAAGTVVRVHLSGR